ncbi:MAG: TRAP transporter large permease subunit [Clostridia bacterium]|nr:TRAP transporter large permease subunit [Clostridia bacterium]
MTAAIVLFALTYVLILAFGKWRTYIALGSGLIFILSGMLPLGMIMSSIDFNVLLMIIGTMGLVSLFTESRMPMLMADMVMEKVPDVKWAAVSLALFAGIISAFVDNVATVLMVAPIGLAICKKLEVNPVPFIIAIAVSSNLQGAATLVGDTTAIMLGSALDMSFLDFFWYKGRPGMFFAVELGAVLSALILLFIFRKESKHIEKSSERTKVTDYVPTILLVMVLVLLIGASFIPNKPDITNGAICCVLLVIGLIYTVIKNKSFSAIINPLKEIDLQTLGILVGIFLMIGGISHMGVIDALAQLLASVGGGNVFVLYTIITIASVIISAFIDNIPYVATMIPVIAGIATALNIDATPLYFGLLSGATLGGNCTPVGASANITGIGILKKAGNAVKNGDFFKIGIPFTIAAVVPAYFFIWFMFGV